MFGQFKAFKSDVINACLISDNFPVSVSSSFEDSCFMMFHPTITKMIVNLFSSDTDQIIVGTRAGR